jgi:hypothetical protein
VAVELTLIQTRKDYNIKGTIQNKTHTINKVHTVQIQTYKVIKGHVLVFVYLQKTIKTKNNFHDVTNRGLHISVTPGPP